MEAIAASVAFGVVVFAAIASWGIVTARNAFRAWLTHGDVRAFESADRHTR